MGNFDKLTENVPVSILPAEAGGQVPMAVMIDQWKAVLEERQETILSLDRVEYEIENSSQNSNPDSTLPTPTSETSEPAVTSKTSTTSKNDLKKKKASTTSKKQKSQSTTSSEVIN